MSSLYNGRYFLVKRIIYISIVFLLVLFGLSKTKNVTAQPSHSIFLPIIANPDNRILLGLYAPEWLGVQSAVDSHLNDMSNWAGVKLTFAGTFIGFGDQNYEAAINMQLDLMFENGYTPFVNIMATNTASDIANGQIDKYIIDWANALKKYTRDGQRIVYLAPLPEMNGDWVPYGTDPEGFITAYKRIQNKFFEAGVPKESTRWVFAPNGASTPGNEFENYYPGDDIVDVVGFSTYNKGYCQHHEYWASLEKISKEYIERMRKMAPTKPIFLTQVGTSAQTVDNGYDHPAKDQWLREGYDYLSSEANVRGVIYFNYDGECDLAIYRAWESNFPKTYDGYRQSINNSSYGYIPPTQLIDMYLQP